MFKKCFVLIATIIFSLNYSLPLYALPEGENVVSGSANFTRLDENTLNISTSDRVIINYDSFSIAEPEAVHFLQPSSQSVALNRVVGVNPSEILGVLTANGKIYLINPNGILFGPNSQVDTAGLVASTLDIKDSDFLNGNLVFIKNVDKVGASVINQGYIQAKEAILLGSAVKNEGQIVTTLGTTVLASGEKITLGLDTAGMISVVIDEAVKNEISGVSDGVKNTGKIAADGGLVVLTAKALDNVFDYAVNNEGIIEANAIDTSTGRVELIANQRVNVAGEINAQGGIVYVDSQGANFSGNINSSEGIFNANDGDTEITDITYTGDKTWTDNGNIIVTGNIIISGGFIKLLADYDLDGVGDLNLGNNSIEVDNGYAHYLQGANDFTLDSTYLNKLSGGNYLYVASTGKSTGKDKEDGKITVDATISKSAGIELRATGDIKVKKDNSITASSGDIKLIADSDEDGSGTLSLGNKVVLTVGANNGHYLQGANDFTLDSTYLNKLSGGNYLYVASTGKSTGKDKEDGKITVDATISKSAGIELRATGDIKVKKDNSITASSGDIKLIADSDEDGSGTLSLGNKVVLTVGANNGHYLQGANDFDLDDVFLNILTGGATNLSIKSTAGGVTISKSISRNNSIILTSLNGSIIDNNTTGNDLITANLSLFAKNGIGSGNPLETQISTLQATNTNSGDIRINNTGDMYAQNVVNNGGDVYLTASGSIYGQGGDANNPNILADILYLDAGKDIGKDSSGEGEGGLLDYTLYTQVNQLYAYAGGDIGTILLPEEGGYYFDAGIYNSGNLLISEIEAGTLQEGGNVAGGRIGIQAEGDITVGSISGPLEGEEEGKTIHPADVVELVASGSIYAVGGGPHIVSSNNSYLTASSGVVGTISGYPSDEYGPINVDIGGDLVITAGGSAGPLVDGSITPWNGGGYWEVSSNITGTVSGSIVINPKTSSFPGALVFNPPGYVFFNTQEMWPVLSPPAPPPAPTSPAQGERFLRLLSLWPTSETLSFSRIMVMDLANHSGAVFFYHPVTPTEAGAFEGLALTEDMYEFIDGVISLRGEGFFSWFEEELKKEE